MTKYQLEDKKSQESLVDGRGMWHRLDKQPDDSQPAHIYTLRQRLKFQSSYKVLFCRFVRFVSGSRGELTQINRSLENLRDPLLEVMR